MLGLWLITFPPHMLNSVAAQPYTVNCGIHAGRVWAIVNRPLFGALCIDRADPGFPQEYAQVLRIVLNPTHLMHYADMAADGDSRIMVVRGQLAYVL